MRINNNVMALNAHRQLGINQAGASKSMEKLSSGFRINRAGDDAAGLAISEKMRGQIRGLKQATRNAQDGISLIQTTEGALNETHAILQRMRELANQSATDTNTPEDRFEIQKEIDQLAVEITRISTDTEFNTMKVLDGSFKEKFFHIGANQNQNVDLSIADLSASALKVDGANAGEDAKILKATTVVTVVAGVSVAIGDVLTSGTTTPVIEAVKVDGKWYAAKDVVAKSDGTAAPTELKVAEGAKEFAVAKGKVNSTAADVFLTESKADVEGFVNRDVLVDGKGKIQAVKADDDKWYALDDVKASADGEKLEGTSALTINDALAEGKAAGIDVTTREAANTALKTIDNAIKTVSGERSKLGAMQNRLEHTIANLGTSAENLQAAEARIRDLDMAEEIMAFTKNNILQQAATAMLAQANMAPQSVLQLLG